MAVSNRVLSIQSHVVYGYCGNKCATAVFLLNGIDADFIQTVHFSTATNYLNVKGTKMSGDEFNDIVDGLRSNNLLNHTYIYNGYIGDADLLINISSLVETLRRTTSIPRFFVCDPVLGDNNTFYVHDSFARLYKEKVLKNADIIVPNIFEMEVLSGIPIQNTNDVLIALDAVHNTFNIPIVILTSVKIYRHKKLGKDGVRVDESFFNTETARRLNSTSTSSAASTTLFIPSCSHPSTDVKHLPADDSDENAFDLILYASVRDRQNVSPANVNTIEPNSKSKPSASSTLISLVFPYVEGVFVGVGDMFASLFVSHVIKEQDKTKEKEKGEKLPSVEVVKVACERSVTAIHHLLIKTKQEKSKELVVNHCGHELMSDDIKFVAEVKQI